MQTFVPRLRTLVLCAAALAGFTASVGTASAATKPYTVSIAPSSVAGGTTAELTVTLSVPANAKQRLGAAQLTAPAGLSLVPGSLVYAGPGRTTLDGNVITLNEIQVQPGTSRSFTVDAGTSCETTGALSWYVAAKQANEFNGAGNLLAAPNPMPSTTVSECATAVFLRFASQPTDARINETITNTRYSPSGTPVAVEIVDGEGDRVDSDAEIRLTTKTGTSALGGDTAVNAEDGIASFGDINLATPDDYTLEASSTGLDSITSDGFKVSEFAARCILNQDCPGEVSNTRAKVNVLAFSSSTELDPGFLTLSFDAGPTIDCADYQERTLMEDRVLLDVTSLARTKSATLTIDKKQMNKIPNNGASSLNFCFGSPVPFPTKTGLISATQGSYDWDGDGIATPVYVGLLPNCGTAPCVTARKKTGAGDGVITAILPAGDPAMRG